MSDQMPDQYDRLLGALHGLPDVTKTKPSTVRTVVPLVGHSQTFIVQTYRQAGVGDTIFLETMGRDGSLRLVIPPQVAASIARQRDSLTTKSRSAAGKANAEARKERGEQPAFLRRKGGKP